MENHRYPSARTQRQQDVASAGCGFVAQGGLVVLDVAPGERRVRGVADGVTELGGAEDGGAGDDGTPNDESVAWQREFGPVRSDTSWAAAADGEGQVIVVGGVGGNRTESAGLVSSYLSVRRYEALPARRLKPCPALAAPST